MRRRLISAAIVLFSILVPVFFPLCASAKANFDAYYYLPEYYSTVEEAMGRLKNITPMLMGIWDGKLRSAEADRFGIRFFWVDGKATVIPFDKLSWMRIYQRTEYNGPCPWYVLAALSVEGEESPSVRAETRGTAESLYSIIATLAAAAGNPVEMRGLGFSFVDPTEKDLKGAGLKKQAGVTATIVEKGSPVEKGGLREGDIIFSVNGKVVESADQYKKEVLPFTRTADTLEMEVLRKGKKQVFRVRPMPEEKFPAPPKSLTFGQSSVPGKEEKQPPKLGIVLRNLTMGEKGTLKGRTGAVILEVKPGGLAEAMKMQPGDIILFCNGKAVPSVEGFSALLVEGENTFHLLRNGKELTVGGSTVTGSF